MTRGYSYIISIALYSLVKCTLQAPQLVHVIFRHGDRSPTETFPSDPCRESIWTDGFGQLTQEGMVQAHSLGALFKDRYINTTYPDFLSRGYNKSEVFTLSTDTDRTLNTAACVLAAMFPPQDSRRWGQLASVEMQALGSVWQPIPVRSVGYRENPLLSVTVPCQRYDTLHSNLLNSDEAKQLYTQNKEKIEYVCREAGWSKPSLQAAWDTFDSLYCMKQHDIPLPAWVSDEVYEWVEQFASQEFRYWFHDKELIRLKSGTILDMLLNKTRHYIAGTLEEGRKIFLYSSHDSLLAAILVALNAWYDVIPPYTAAILFELHQSESGTYSVRIYYHNHTLVRPHQPYPITLPGCSEDCPWSEFEKLLEPLTLSDFEAECSNMEGIATNQSGIGSEGIVALVLFFVALLACCGVTAIWCERKKRNKSAFKYITTPNYEEETLT